MTLYEVGSKIYYFVGGTKTLNEDDIKSIQSKNVK